MSFPVTRGQPQGVVGRRGQIDDANDDHTRVVTINLGSDGQDKDVSTLFIGTSPEFEFACAWLWLRCVCHRVADHRHSVHAVLSWGGKPGAPAHAHRWHRPASQVRLPMVE